ncbi:Uncharacterised protein [Mycobacteroides abscessus subsp. abscessus]|nr:Uncharacterised protein [Mycobacteroides abscessus subsp. abscessus]
MSMPSSSELVATTQRRRPLLRSSSISARCSLETEPWCARARTVAAPVVAPDAMTIAGAPPPTRSLRGGSRPGSVRCSWISLSRAVRRSARRRELANTMVVRLVSMRSTIDAST